jgi:Wiskott-Aldrich syndrome protein
MMDATIAGEGKNQVHVPPSISQDVAGRQLSPPRPPSTPPLPLSPVSNPTSPTRKRPRTESWRPPPHIPSFFPPFPVERSSLEPEPLSLPPPGEPSTSSTQLLPSKIEPATSLTRVSSANPADYTTIVPYSLSNLASTPEWHLPSTLRESRAPVDPLPPPQLPIPQIQPSLLGAYHHILTHPPPPNPNLANPSRHRVAMVLLRQAQKNPHWEPADSLYATTAPNSPTVAPVGPSYAIPISSSSSEDKKEKEDEKDKKLNLPGAAPRPIGTQERIVPLASHQTSRIPELAREALSVRNGFPPLFFLLNLRLLQGAVLSRVTRLSHPTVLQRGPEKLTYGTGIPAPWNNPDRSSGPAPMPSTGTGKEPLANGLTLTNGKGKEAEKGPVLPDARLFATWEHEQKSFRDPLTIPRRARQGSVLTSLAVSNAPGRARGESRAG